MQNQVPVVAAIDAGKCVPTCGAVLLWDADTGTGALG
jgi:hypothetical protein